MSRETCQTCQTTHPRPHPRRALTLDRDTVALIIAYEELEETITQYEPSASGAPAFQETLAAIAEWRRQADEWLEKWGELDAPSLEPPLAQDGRE